MNLQLATVSTDAATTGVLSGLAFALYSIELPWLDNQGERSCVPPGLYQLCPYVSPSHGNTYRLHNPALNVYGDGGAVPTGGRSQIELHSANWCRQLLGCIAFGLSGQPMVDPLDGCAKPAVEDSRDAIAELMGALGFTPGHTLAITRRFAS